ncbi:acyl carrier protein [Saccharomonospora piscinae]|uniref:Acyl carrier protein n=1 Tax=Saccharomonospora piscinae TaxID=687388 RepID=A0A1V9ACF1_SACPI|nr:acyl carrier protein [Saccharomonospora piscinae]OQO94807.1 acyl carrier protein [Saccharomonospora piscinae]TLW94483.1 acyl carrier protein [Saccharomonospora piscinae]
MTGPDITLEQLRELLATGSGVRIDTRAVTAATTFDDLGLDSLALLGVIATIERARGVLLPSEAQETRSVLGFLSLVNDTLRKAA